jgi:restriction system protein
MLYRAGRDVVETSRGISRSTSAPEVVRSSELSSPTAAGSLCMFAIGAAASTSHWPARSAFRGWRVKFDGIDSRSGENMGRFENDRRAAELEAYQALWHLWRTSQRAVMDVNNWESACRMLQTDYTVGKARHDSEVCAMRIRYLEISEPAPQLADFVYAPPYYRVPDAPRQLTQARYEYRLAWQRHPGRERMRVKELETTKALYQTVKAAEAKARAAEIARQREWQQSRWPEDLVLESEIYNLDGLAAQVDLQNAKIESQVNALTCLLQDGLQNLADVSESELTLSCRGGDPAGVAAQIESVLTALPLPRVINPKAKVEYSADSRQLVVEYELPTVDVVPKAKSYRYVKSAETVVEVPRPASQRKALYASTIAQLTLLSLAAIVEFDSERHIDAVVFNGVVDTLDPRSGEPTRPCLITVRVTADTFAEINFEHIDPSACLEHLSATVSRNPAALVPVRPLLE